MSKPGPQPTPTAVLDMRGSWRAKARKNEPKPPAGKAICPARLSVEAKRHWKRLATRLYRMGVLSVIDREAFARYCSLLARWYEVERVNDIDASMKISAHLLQLEREFGMTPSARASMATTEPNPRENRGKNPNPWARTA